MDLKIFDDAVPYHIREQIWNFCMHSTFYLGWSDSDETEKDSPNAHSNWNISEIESTNIMPYFEKCIKDTRWFKNKKISNIILNLVRPDDVHYIHHHMNKQVLLYYVNLSWTDGWHGETLFYNPHNLKEVEYTSLYVPGRIILFDGTVPHAIRPQSVKATKFRFSLSLFFE